MRVHPKLGSAGQIDQHRATANGITGVAEDLTRAHFEVATALAAGIRVLVVTPADIENLTSTDELVTLLKKKLCQLVVSGTNFLKEVEQ